MSTAAPQFVPFAAAPGRSCGTCTLCCKVFEVPSLQKPAGSWCRHCSPGAGCAIHETRPPHCREFFCLWMTDPTMPEEWKPEHSKIVMTYFPGNGFLYAQVDPGSPQAWRKAPYYDRLKALARRLNEKGRHVVVFVNDSATLIMPDEAIPLGPMKPTDNFKIDRSFGPKGATYQVTRV